MNTQQHNTATRNLPTSGARILVALLMFAATEVKASQKPCDLDAADKAALAITAACPCDGPTEANNAVAPWASHHKYLTCVAHAAKEQRASTGLKRHCLRSALTFAKHSTCGSVDTRESSPQAAAVFGNACQNDAGPSGSWGRNVTTTAQEACISASGGRVYVHALFAMNGTGGVYSHSSTRRFSTNVTITDATTGQWWGATCTHTGWQETFNDMIHWRFCDFSIAGRAGHYYYTRAQTAFDVRDDGKGLFNAPSNHYTKSPTKRF